MIFYASDMTVRSPKVLEKLRAYLANISRYSNFDPNMRLRLFVSSDGDFTAFEAVDYRLGFTSADHKLVDTIKSSIPPVELSFRDFASLVESL